jgi:hypothetical protein
MRCAIFLANSGSRCLITWYWWSRVWKSSSSRSGSFSSRSHGVTFSAVSGAGAEMPAGRNAAETLRPAVATKGVVSAASSAMRFT